MGADNESAQEKIKRLEMDISLLREGYFQLKKAKTALEEGSIRYRRLFETFVDGILFLDYDTGKVVDVNPFLTELLGLPREKFLGKELWQLGVFRDIAKNKLNYLQLKRKKFIRYENLPMETFDNRYINVEFISNIYAVGGKKVVQCNIRDNTEHEKANRKIKMLSSVVEQATDGMAIAGLDGKLTFVNEAWRKMHGYKSAKELFGKSLAIFHSKEQIENDVKPFNEKVMKFGACSGEIGHVTKHGKLFQTLMTTTLLKDDYGKPYALSGIITDITERKKAEEVIKETEAKYRNIVENSPEMIHSVDMYGKVIFANKREYELLGYKDGELIGIHIKKLYSPDLLKQVYEGFEKLKKEGKLHVPDSKMIKKNGDFINVEIRSIAVYDNKGQFIHTRSIIRDITDEKKARDELAKKVEQMEFIGRTNLKRHKEMLEMKKEIERLKAEIERLKNL